MQALWLLLGLASTADARPTERQSPTPMWRPPLQFKNGTFQISIFEDLHFGENAWDSWGPQQDINTIKVLEKVLDFDPPDLVVLNGDLITGDNAFAENATAVLDQLLGPMHDRGVPWASTYGNHDSQFNLSKDAILEHENRYPGSYTQNMVPGRESGVSNYYLPIFPGDCDRNAKCAPALILWFFDSRGGFYPGETGPDGEPVGVPNWVDFSVVNWFQQTNAQLVQKYHRVIPSLAFVHIPTYASQALQMYGPGVDPNRQPGIDDDKPLAPQAEGYCHDGTNDGSCSYGGQDIPFMHALATAQGLMAVFSGHDHGATWCFKWEGVVPGMTVSGNGLNLCFGQHTGYGGYGNWIRGGRQVLISEDEISGAEMIGRDGIFVNTWMRLESGEVVGAVTLNSTYNRDVYPKTPNSMTYCPTCNYSSVTPMPGT